MKAKKQSMAAKILQDTHENLHKEAAAVREAGASKEHPTSVAPLTIISRPTNEFTRILAAEIAKNLATFRDFTVRPFQRKEKSPEKKPVFGDYPILVDTSVLIDGRILPIANSGFLVGTLIVPDFVLGEVQHIADSSDSLRRAKGRRGLDVTDKLKSQRVNPYLKVRVMKLEAPDSEVDHKLVTLAKKHKVRLLTGDFNLAQYARAHGVKVMNVIDLAQAIKVAIMPGEEFSLKVTHEGKEREQGVGYLPDGTMVVVDDAKQKVGQEVSVLVTKVHQTPAGQLFFARLK